MLPLADLLARLREATEGNADLDCAIYAYLHPHLGDPDQWHYNFRGTVYRYSRSLDAAMTLFEEKPWATALKLERNTADFGKAWHAAYRHQFFGHAPTPALALCIAALTARQEKP